MSACIPLTQDQVTLVDDEDFILLTKRKWCAWYNRSSSSYYAKTALIECGVKKVVSLHRYLLEVNDPKLHVDHINGDTLDNRRINLRVCTAAQNTKNHTKPNKFNKSGYRGVCWSKDKQKWKAYITAPVGKHKHLGYYDNIIEAAKAFNEAAIKHYGEFHGKLNIFDERNSA